MELDLEGMEQKWRDFWQSKDVYAFHDKKGNEKFVIDTPPPTISGEIHMGHGFGYVHQDIIARYKRMRGFNVFYPMGFDDNGLPTEKFAEKMFGKRSNEIPREEFLELCEKARVEGRSRILEVFRLLGISADLNSFYLSNSSESRKITQTMFIDLLDKKRAYREKGTVVICPVCRTAISQIDMKDMQRDTEFYYISFGKMGSVDLEIATTRPEMLGACVALCVNPDDPRYSGVVGKEAKVPLYGHAVRIIADQYVDAQKGTGMEMICTFGDQNDVDLWKKHKLETRIIIDLYGRMLGDSIIQKGSISQDARRKVAQALKDRNLLTRSERKKQNINVHERCDTPLEIGISDQWFVRYLDLKESLLQQGRKVTWYPEFMRIRYENWVNGLKFDWCISRQRISGIPFPVWYCRKCGTMHVAERSQLPLDPRKVAYTGKCSKCGSTEFDPDTDVMDTWATSSLSPRLAQIPKHLFPQLYPTDIRFQGHDIIVAWAFTTIVRSLIHDESLPWKGVYVNGMVRNPQGVKMSKSRGTGHTPIDFIKEYGTDALRHWTTVAGNGEDLVVSDKDLLRGRRTVIKILNAANLVKELGEGEVNGDPGMDMPEHWILAKLRECATAVTARLDDYDISHARSALDNFFWNAFCDRYLEICKPRIRSELIPDAGKARIRHTLLYVFDSILKMYAPVIPFVTEELYHLLNTESTASIHESAWPEVLFVPDMQQSDDMEYVIGIIDEIRSSLSAGGMKGTDASERRIRLRGRRALLAKTSLIIEALARVKLAELIDSEESGLEIVPS